MLDSWWRHPAVGLALLRSLALIRIHFCACPTVAAGRRAGGAGQYLDMVMAPFESGLYQPFSDHLKLVTRSADEISYRRILHDHSQHAATFPRKYFC